MPDCKPNTVWASYPPGTYPQTYISVADEKNIQIEFCPAEAMPGEVVKLTRHHARVLANRILQCLEKTKKTRKGVNQEDNSNG